MYGHVLSVSTYHDDVDMGVEIAGFETVHQVSDGAVHLAEHRVQLSPK